jgi:hypothetical protein
MKTSCRKLTDQQVREIRAAMKLRDETNPKRLAFKYGVSKFTIYNIANGREYVTNYAVPE